MSGYEASVIMPPVGQWQRIPLLLKEPATRISLEDTIKLFLKGTNIIFRNILP